MKKYSKAKQVKNVKDWWNLPRNDIKWGKDYEDLQNHGSRYLISRKEIVLKYLDELKLDKGSNILELGYGGGQVALEIGKRGFNTYGLDISKNFSKTATSRCRNSHPSGFFDLRVGSIESKYDFEDKFFDTVIVVGALQYLFDLDECFKEVSRVLKPRGHFIIAQRNIYSLSNFTSIKLFIRSCLQFLLREKFELSPSFKSLLTESKIGYFCGKYKDCRFFNTKFMLKGHTENKFEINKRTNSYFSLKSELKKNGYNIEKAGGAYYAFSEDVKYYAFNIKSDNALKYIVEKGIIPYLFTLGRSVVLKAQKKY